MQGILHKSEEREFSRKVARADEFARGLDGLANKYGSTNPKDWDDLGRGMLSDLMNNYPDLTGTRPGGNATYQSIEPAGDGVAAVVTVDDGKGKASTGPITKNGSTEDDDEVVIGVEFDGDARAYSVPLLSNHEIVNDTVGGVKLAVTW